MGRKYEAGVVYIGRTVDIVYDPADISTITLEDNSLGTAFRINELIIGTHTGPRSKLPEFMTSVKPETSRLLDAKEKTYQNRNENVRGAISFKDINAGLRGDGNV
jgi:hypothetical protein